MSNHENIGLESSLEDFISERHTLAGEKLSEIEQACAELGKGKDSGFVIISHLAPDAVKFTQIGRFAVDAFDMDAIAKKYGGGDYKLRFTKSNGAVHSNVRLDIHPALVKSSKGEQMPQFEKRESLRDILAGLKEAGVNLGGNPVNNRDQNEMLFKMMLSQQQSFTQILVAMIGNQNKGTDLETVLKLVQPTDPLAQMEFLERMDALRNKQQSNPTIETKDETMFEKILQLVPATLQAITAGRGSQPQQSGARQIATSSTGNALGIDPTTQILISKFLKRCIKAAETDADPFKSYCVIEAACEPTQYGQVKGILSREDWLDILFANNEVYKQDPYLSWFGELRELILNDGELPAQDQDQDQGQPSNPVGFPESEPVKVYEHEHEETQNETVKSKNKPVKRSSKSTSG